MVIGRQSSEGLIESGSVHRDLLLDFRHLLGGEQRVVIKSTMVRGARRKTAFAFQLGVPVLIKPKTYH